MLMKICILSPYIPKHFGGGEKYLMDVASTLSGEHEVSIAIPDTRNAYGTSNNGLRPPARFDARRAVEAGITDYDDYKKKYEDFLGRSLKNIDFIPSPFFASTSFLEKLLWTRQFDVLYYATDGSLFFSLAKKNVLHIQVPLQLNKSSLIERFKLLNWQVKNTNSGFTKKFVEKWWGTKIDFVHYPLAALDSQAAGSRQQDKKKIILNVGRFFRQLHSKRQDVLVDIFKQMLSDHPKESKGWKLVLIGSVEDQEYAKEVEKKAKGLPIEIHHDVSRQELLEWYSRSSIYWHATGFGVDEDKHPEKQEHFGITTVEAMSYGCVPVVIKRGGQVEILGQELAELLWESKEECVEKTLWITNDACLPARQGLRMKQYSELAVKRSKEFGEDKFKKTLLKMIL